MNDTQIAQSPNKTKSNNTRLIIIISAIVIGLCIIVSVLIGIGGFFAYRGISAPVEPIKKQLELINQGKVSQAYEKYSSNDFKNATSFSDFSSMVKSNPQIFKSKKSSFTNVETNNKKSTVSGTITGQDGTTTSMTYNLVYEDDRWLILGFKKT